jgi:U4/U6.U5 tri-snRNP-associated protein 2
MSRVYAPQVCSISLSNMNVYACLVCGKYFQGRGKNTYAYTHSVQASHHVFMNLHNGKIYCLPGKNLVLVPHHDKVAET